MHTIVVVSKIGHCHCEHDTSTGWSHHNLLLIKVVAFWPYVLELWIWSLSSLWVLTDSTTPLHPSILYSLCLCVALLIIKQRNTLACCVFPGIVLWCLLIWIIKQISSKFGELWLFSPLRLNAETALKCYWRKKKTILEISSPSLQFTSLLLCTLQPKFPLFRSNLASMLSVSVLLCFW